MSTAFNPWTSMDTDHLLYPSPHRKTADPHSGVDLCSIRGIFIGRITSADVGGLFAGLDIQGISPSTGWWLFKRSEISENACAWNTSLVRNPSPSSKSFGREDL